MINRADLFASLPGQIQPVCGFILLDSGYLLKVGLLEDNWSTGIIRCVVEEPCGRLIELTIEELQRKYRLPIDGARLAVASHGVRGVCVLQTPIPRVGNYLFIDLQRPQEALTRERGTGR